MTPSQAALYLRISEDKQGEGLGVERQERECREWAAKNGWQIAEPPYVDNDKSAYSGKPRPDYQKMLAALKAGKHDGILCWAVDRLARNLHDFADVADLKPLLGVATAGVYDLEQPSGQLVLTMLGGSAIFEVQQKGKRHNSELRQKAEAGLPMTHKRPFGWTDNTLQTLHPEESKHIQDAASDLLAGASVRGLVVKWNASGIKTSTGKTWARVTFRQLMGRWSNAAVPVYRGEPLLDVQGQWTPILDRPTLEAVRAITSPGGVQKVAAKSVLLSGILRCGKCGKPMIGNSGRMWCTNIQNGLCSQTISGHLVENRIIGWTLHQVHVHAQRMMEEDHSSEERAKIETELAQIRADRKYVASAEWSAASKDAEYKSLDARESALQEQSASRVRQSIKGALIHDLAPMVTIDAIKAEARLDELETLGERWEKLDFAQKRLLLKEFGTFKINPGRGASRLEIVPASLASA
jgi:site-specific DNA recombinase